MVSCAHVEKPSDEIQVTARGDQLSRPGSYSVPLDTTLTDILKKAGISEAFLGTSHTSPVNIRVMRRSLKGNGEVFNANLSTVQSRRCRGFLLQDGDLINITPLR